MEEYDILVLGGGPAGISAALRAAENGARVCLVERDRLGGAYLHQGFFQVREVLRYLAQSSSGAPTGSKENGNPDVSELFRRAQEKACEEGSRWRTQLEDYGVHLTYGLASLVSSRLISLTADDKETSLKAEKIILAAGSSPKSPSTMPLDGDHILSPDDICNLKETPESILILGGKGYALELAVLLNRLGSKVFFCTEADRLLPGMDLELSSIFENNLKKQKIKLLLNKKIISYYKKSDNLDINLDGGVKFPVHKILICGGRQGNMRKTDLENIGVRVGGANEVLVDQHMATSAEGVFAAGSVTGAEFTDFTEEQGRAAADNAMGKSKPFNADWIPRIVFTQPEIACVGCSIHDAHHKGFRAVEGSFGQGTHSPDSEGSLFKIVADKSSRTVIGAQIVSPGASEIIPLVLLAMRRGLTVTSLASVPCAMSSQAHGIREAAKACERALKAQLKGF